MSCCLSVYFLVVFKTFKRAVNCLQLSVYRVGRSANTLFFPDCLYTRLASWRLKSLLPMETLFASPRLAVPKSLPQVPSPPTLGLSTSGYTAV